jgi:hypothetical protein
LTAVKRVLGLAPLQRGMSAPVTVCPRRDLDSGTGVLIRGKAPKHSKGSKSSGLGWCIRQQSWRAAGAAEDNQIAQLTSDRENLTNREQPGTNGRARVGISVPARQESAGLRDLARPTSGRVLSRRPEPWQAKRRRPSPFRNAVQRGDRLSFFSLCNFASSPSSSACWAGAF